MSQEVRPVAPFERPTVKKDYYLNMGPQHPSTHGVLRLLLHMDGESVLDCTPYVGYSHRAQEKLAESKVYMAYFPFTSRMDYLCGLIYNWGWAAVVERMMGIQVPRRAEFIRVIVAELNRLTSHLLWLGTYLLDLGGMTPFFYCFDDREQILDILEETTGSRLTYNYMRFGGVEQDLPAGFADKARAFIKGFRKRLRDYDILITKNIIFIVRTKDIAVLPAERALEYGVTGPNLRGSGVRYDVRRSEPYGVYPELDFEIPLGNVGDTFDRYNVRMQEMEQSCRIIEQALDKMPDGPVRAADVPKVIKPPKGEAYFAVESARGQLGYYVVSDGSTIPYRVKVRTPSFSNLAVLPSLLTGYKMSDVVSILGGFDVVLPEIDR
jgi:NADH-quinone oxidoreductase subunit D